MINVYIISLPGNNERGGGFVYVFWYHVLYFSPLIFLSYPVLRGPFKNLFLTLIDVCSGIYHALLLRGASTQQRPNARCILEAER